MSRRNRSVLAWCACVLLLPLLYFVTKSRGYIAKPCWDSLVYAKAITNFIHGGTPYVTMGHFFFVYPPVVPLAGKLLAYLLTPHVGWYVFNLTNMFCVVATPYVIARYYLRQLTIGEGYLLYCLAPGFLFLPVFFGGNIAAPCYFAAIVAAIPGLRRGNWVWFYIATIAVANVKITLLLLLLIPFLVGVRQLLPCIVTTLATAGFYLVQKFGVPDLYRQFQSAIATQTFVGRDYGIGIFGAAGNLMKRLSIAGFSIPWALQILFMAAVLGVLWKVRRNVDLKDERWLALTLVTVVLLNPRIVVYDAFLAVIPAYFLLVLNVRRPIAWIAVALSISGYFIGHGALGYLFGLIAVFVVGVFDLSSGNKAHTIA